MSTLGNRHLMHGLCLWATHTMVPRLHWPAPSSRSLNSRGSLPYHLPAGSRTEQPWSRTGVTVTSCPHYQQEQDSSEVAGRGQLWAPTPSASVLLPS